MKNKFPYSVLLAMLLFSGHLFAQDEVFKFDESKNNVSIGYDFRNLRKIKSTNEFGPMFFKYERAFSKNIGLGGVSYLHHDKSYHENDQLVYTPNGEILKYNYSITGFSIIPKINWHFSVEHFKNKRIKNLDLYVGVGIGYGFETEKYDYLMKDESIINYDPYVDKRENSHFVATEFNAGVRFYALEHFGAYFEMGFGLSRAQLGLIYKW